MMNLALAVAGIATTAEEGTGDTFRRRPWIHMVDRVHAAVAAKRWGVALVELLHTEPDLQEAAKTSSGKNTHVHASLHLR